MTILQSLARRYSGWHRRTRRHPGFAPSQISFTIILDRDGRYVTTQDERIGEGKRLRPQNSSAPAAPKRTVGIASGAFWDKTSYARPHRHGRTSRPPSRRRMSNGSSRSMLHFWHGTKSC